MEKYSPLKIFVFILVIIFFALSSKAEDSLQVKSIVKLAFLPVLSGYSDQLNYLSYRTQVSLTYEKNKGKKTTPYLQASFLGPINLWIYPGTSIAKQNTLGFGLTAGYRKYSTTQLQGFYYGLAAQYFHYSIKDPALDSSIKTVRNEWEVKLLGGRQSLKGKKLVVDVFTGMGILLRRNKTFISNPSDDASVRYYFGFHPYLGIQLGLASFK